MGRACSMHRRDEKIHTQFWSENLKGRDCLEDIDVDVEIVYEGVY
jgi:hypothetical protein